MPHDIVHTDHDCRFRFDLVQCLWKWRPHSSTHAIIHLQKKKERKEWKEEEEEEEEEAAAAAAAAKKIVSKKTKSLLIRLES